jgi:hypothetical protein
MICGGTNDLFINFHHVPKLTVTLGCLLARDKCERNGMGMGMGIRIHLS